VGLVAIQPAPLVARQANLMMERSYRQTAETIRDWLVEQETK
jgi:hypothetical protein